MALSHRARWTLLPLAAIAGCGAVGVAGRGAQDWYLALVGPQRVDVTLPLDAQDALRYFVEAFVFVAAGTVIAPRARPLVASLLFAVGAYLAWQFLGDWTWEFPESHPRGYQISYLPLGGALTGGLSSLALLWLPSVRRALTAVGDRRPG